MSKEEKAQYAIDEIDGIATDYDHYEFGLPTYNPAVNSQLVDVIVSYGDEYAQSLAKEVIEELEKEKQDTHEIFKAGVNKAIYLIKQKFNLS